MISRAPRSTDKGTLVKNKTSSLSLKQFLELIPLDVDLEKARHIALKEKQLTVVPLNIGLLLREVRRLDLSGNDLRDVSPLASLQHLTSINLTKNARLVSIAPLSPLKLTVCIVARCSLHSLIGLEGSAMTLKTLIANDNHLILQSPKGSAVVGAETDVIATAVKNYEVLSLLTACETVVLSRNPLLCSLHAVSSANEEQDLQEKERCTTGRERPHREADWSHPLSVLEMMLHLKKLSLSGCHLTSLPSHWFLPMVTELRLSHNELSDLVPEGVIFRSVQILDVSHNALTDISTLRRCRFVHHLGIRGNPLLNDDNAIPSQEIGSVKVPVNAAFPPSMVRSLAKMMPHLKMVDGTPFSSLQKREVETGNNCEECSAASECDAKHVMQKRLRSSAGEEKEEERNVVFEPPEEVVDTPQAPIVRREQTNLLSRVRRELVANGPAVAQLVKKQKVESSGW